MSICSSCFVSNCGVVLVEVFRSQYSEKLIYSATKRPMNEAILVDFWNIIQVATHSPKYVNHLKKVTCWSLFSDERSKGDKIYEFVFGNCYEFYIY